SFIIDLTERRRAEEHIHKLSQELLKAQENERHKISRELHDNVAQDLSTIKLKFENLFNDLPDEIKGKIEKYLGSLHDSITVVRDMAYDLRPPILDQLGLIRAISQFCDDFSEKTGLTVNFHSAGMDDSRLDFDSEINLYRLVQEGLNNINKHAHATELAVRLVASFPNIILRVEDNGRGFDVKERMLRASAGKRMGLRSMEERAGLLGGQMKVQSRIGSGTHITIEIPYR
ncbi:MAG: sensor histidine kinase, partial [Thermodesulfobacteriota bacterium]|nr:sensor histidine kinase [Thermodesulfobacteriota bacterium]